MKTSIPGLSRLLTAACLSWCALASSAFAANTVTIKPSSATYAAAGGTLTFTVTLAYASTTTVPGLSVTAPKGWTFVSAGGTNVPSIQPQPGDTGSLDFTYLQPPQNTANFSFVVRYPSGLTGNQTFSPILGIFRPETTPESQPAIVLTPAN